MTGIGIIITAAVALIIGGVAGYAIFRYVIKGKYNEMIDAANKEAEVIKEKKLLEVKEKFLNKKSELEKEVQVRNQKIQQNENRLKQREISLNQRQEELGRRKQEIEQMQLRLDNENKLLGIKQEELEKIGISENDYLLLRSWNFADNEVFSLEVMEKAAQIISDYKENVEISKEAILEGMQERQYFNYPGCIAFVILFVLTAAWGNKYFWAGLPAAGMGVLYLIYFFVIERVVYRTEFGIFLCMFLCLCF